MVIRTAVVATWAILGFAMVEKGFGQESSREETPGETLRRLADARDFKIGAAVSPHALRRDPRYGETLAREFNILVTENALKFSPLRPERERFYFDDADAIVAFAEENGMEVRGHTLVWHHALPAWLEKGGFEGDELREILEEHIHTVVSRYRGRVRYWDVVNEAIADGTAGLRESLWSKGVGPDYVELAFRRAHAADPDARLFYNDYGGEGLGPKSDAIYEFVSGMLEKGVPVHGIGLQMHVDLRAAGWLDGLARNMERLGALGLEVHITELDVRLKDSPSAEDLESQANLYGSILNVALGQEACRALLTWGFTDRHSWIPHFYKGYGSALIFDASYEAKPAYHELTRVLKADPSD
jgi:endo-1,4-beta-xylanase